MVEQPGSSLMFAYKFFQDLFSINWPQSWKRSWTWMYMFGHVLPKPTILMHTLHEVAHKVLGKTYSKARLQKSLASGKIKLGRGCSISFSKRNFQKRRKPRDQFYTKARWVTGGAHLAESGIYTKRFCSAVVEAWKLSNQYPRISVGLGIDLLDEMWEKCGFSLNDSTSRMQNVQTQLAITRQRQLVFASDIITLCSSDEESSDDDSALSDVQRALAALRSVAAGQVVRRSASGAAEALRAIATSRQISMGSN